MNLFCPICDSKEIEQQGLYRGKSKVFQHLKLVHCITCDFIFAAPMPSESLLKDYNESYFHSAHGGQSTSVTSIAFFRGIAHLRMNHIDRFLKNKNINVNSVLECGPGAGYFAKKWLGHHSGNKYTAIETDRSCYESLHKMGVNLAASSSDLKDFDTHDLVVLSHVLEHVSNPYEFLNSATKNLRNGGAVFIEVPCQDWVHKSLDEPHLLFFDKKSMNRLMEKMGFEDIKVSYHGASIKQLSSSVQSRLFNYWMLIRTKLIASGILFPFSYPYKGMENMENSLERAMVSPFQAHKEKVEASWWLRCMAIKAVN
jgi:SAM-dependent methyltransferase